MRTRTFATTLGLIAATTTLAGCGLAPGTPTTTASSTTAAAPPIIIMPPRQPQPAPQTQYVPYYNGYYPGYSYPSYTAPSYSGSASDADFLSRLRARDIVTPGDSAEVAAGQQVCSNLESGSSITPEANKLMGSPYSYSASLAGYFAGEAIKVYCPQYSGQLR